MDWGSIDMQWYGSLLPRIHTFLPAATILEIAPGAGRWTQFLKDHCSKLILVDLSAQAMVRCRKRFKDCSHIQYYVNDGRSLSMVRNDSVDLIFSFNSLVHADADALEAYVRECALKLSKDGVGFIHHSNLGYYTPLYRRFSKVPALGRHLCRLAGFGEVYLRSFNTSAMTFRRVAESHDLSCIRQEFITWRDSRVYLDCLTTFTRKGSCFDREARTIWNRRFRKEIRYISALSHLYSHESLCGSRQFTAPESSVF